MPLGLANQSGSWKILYPLCEQAYSIALKVVSRAMLVKSATDIRLASHAFKQPGCVVAVNGVKGLARQPRMHQVARGFLCREKWEIASKNDLRSRDEV